MNNPVKVLDHGYVRLVEAWGHGDAGIMDGSLVAQDNECGIIEAARQSTQGNFKGWDADAKLLRYLYANNHATPFEFSGMVIEVQAPLFVFREWHRHRTQSYNEMSARYAPLPDLYYLPTPDQLRERSEAAAKTTNKQAGGTEAVVLDKLQAQRFYWDLEEHYQTFEKQYQAALSAGVPKELARLGMPVGHYSRMRASTNLRNWLAFITLRADTKAQWEIQQYAKAVGSLLAAQFPRTWALFAEEHST